MGAFKNLAILSMENETMEPDMLPAFLIIKTNVLTGKCTKQGAEKQSEGLDLVSSDADRNTFGWSYIIIDTARAVVIYNATSGSFHSDKDRKTVSDYLNTISREDI